MRIFRELVNIRTDLLAVRRELQAVRKLLESAETVYMLREPHENCSFVRAGRDGSSEGLNTEWRRFELLTEDRDEIDRFTELCKQKNLSREDLARILFTLRVRPGFGREDFGI